MNIMMENHGDCCRVYVQVLTIMVADHVDMYRVDDFMIEDHDNV